MCVCKDERSKPSITYLRAYLPYQIRELSRQKQGDSLVLQETCDRTRRELAEERALLAARESRMRALERELAALQRQRAEEQEEAAATAAAKKAALQEEEEAAALLRRRRGGGLLPHRDFQAEVAGLQEQLAAEKRAKDALLLDMADIRRHGKQQLRELLEELKEFDR